jgi:hypothetical protein
VACLELHEQWVGTVLDHVRVMRMTQAVDRQLSRQPGVRAALPDLDVPDLIVCKKGGEDERS